MVAVQNDSLLMVRVKGTHRQMGQQIGEAAALHINRMIQIYKAAFIEAYDELELTWEDGILQASKYYPFAQEYTPQYVDELEGIAEGAQVDIDDLMVVNCAEAILSDKLVLGCTSIAVSAERTKNGH